MKAKKERTANVTNIQKTPNSIYKATICSNAETNPFIKIVELNSKIWPTHRTVNKLTRGSQSNSSSREPL